MIISLRSINWRQDGSVIVKLQGRATPPLGFHSQFQEHATSRMCLMHVDKRGQYIKSHGVSFSLNQAGRGKRYHSSATATTGRWDPAQLVGAAKSQYGLCSSFGNSATQRQAYRVATYSLCWYYWKIPKTAGKSNFQMLFSQNFSVAQNNVLYLCFKTCSGSNGNSLEIDEVILAKNVFLGIFLHWPA